MTASAFRPAATPSLLQVARPFLLLAALAFFAGFGGYLILGPDHVMRAAETAPVATVAAPMTAASTAPEPTSDDWNLPKKI